MPIAPTYQWLGIEHQSASISAQAQPSLKFDPCRIGSNEAEGPSASVLCLQGGRNDGEHRPQFPELSAGRTASGESEQGPFGWPELPLSITRASRMSELADRLITAIAAVGGSAAFLEVVRRWLQRRQDKRQEQVQFDVRILAEGHALRQEAYQREREALQALAEERERRHKAELLALEAQMQAKLEALTRINEDLTRSLDRANALFRRRARGKASAVR
jgi:hypothetical protein